MYIHTYIHELLLAEGQAIRHNDRQEEARWCFSLFSRHVR